MPASPFTCVGFPPSIDEGCTHIILGSMPGAASLKAQQYYAYPQNRFWRLMAYLLEGGEPPQDYAARLQMLLRHRIALWDSIASCEREGSLDSAIRAAKPNDFTALLVHYPRLSTFCLNGGKSAETGSVGADHAGDGVIAHAQKEQRGDRRQDDDGGIGGHVAHDADEDDDGDEQVGGGAGDSDFHQRFEPAGFFRDADADHGSEDDAERREAGKWTTMRPK